MDSKFVVFEAIRKRKGGGTLIAAHKDFQPKLIEEYSDNFELLVVELITEEKEIRIISGYGPQEIWDEEKRLPFFLALETEIEKAELAGRSIIIEMDSNSKLGTKYIEQDPHVMSPNGSLLSGIIERHGLIVGNGTNKCKGTITRKRITKHRVEQSVIDHVIFSSDLLKYFISMHIDESRKHVLTRIRKTKKGISTKESDHNVLVTEFKCKVKHVKDKESKEMYNLKDKECQAKFKKYTSTTKMLSSTISDEGDINDSVERFMKKLKGCIAINFKKTRIKDNNVKDDKHLYDKMRSLKDKDDDESKMEMEKTIQNIAQSSSENFKKLKDELNKLKPEDNRIDSKLLWKLKKKLCPRAVDAPSAMNDKEGNLITADRALKNLALEAYTQRLKENKIEPHLEDLENDTNTLCEIRVKLAKENKTEPWTLDNLKEALKDLGNGKSRDRK